MACYCLYNELVFPAKVYPHEQNCVVWKSRGQQMIFKNMLTWAFTLLVRCFICLHMLSTVCKLSMLPCTVCSIVQGLLGPKMAAAPADGVQWAAAGQAKATDTACSSNPIIVLVKCRLLDLYLVTLRLMRGWAPCCSECWRMKQLE